MAKYLLGIDLGTSCCKIGLFQDNCQEVCSATREYSTIFPQKGWAEQNSNDWWNAVIATLQEIFEKTGIHPSEIHGIGVDSQSSIPLPIDKHGKALRPGLLWMDRRAVKQCRWIEQNLKQELWEINGNHNDPSNIAPKILWIKENEPDVYTNTHKFLHANGYLVFKLTGTLSMDISEGGLTQLFDTKKGCWSQELISGCGIVREKLPEIYNCFDVAGYVTQEAARVTGLQTGTPVVAGSMDMVAATLGKGVISHGQIALEAGTATVVGGCLDNPRFNQALHIYHHIIPNRWITAAGVDFGGGGLRWFRDLLEHTDYAEIAQLARLSQPGSDGLIFLPYMIGQRSPLWNDHTRGVILGLNPSTKKQDLIRMFMEGNAFGIRYIFDIFEQTGLEINAIKMTGGSTRIELWPQIIADVIGNTIEIPYIQDAAALGSAITAGIGVGIFKDFEEALEMLPSSKMVYPEMENKELYNQMYHLYCRFYNNIQEEFDVLAEIRQKFL